MASKNRRMFELRLGKLGLILFIGGMSLLLFSMFFLGIFIGKHMEAYPERFSAGLAGGIREHLFASAETTENTPPSAAEMEKRDEPAAGEENFNLTFYDTLGGGKGAADRAVDATKVRPAERTVPRPAVTGKPASGESLSGSATGMVGNSSPPIVAGVGKKPTPLPEGKPVAGPGSGIPAALGPAVVGEGTRGEGRFEIQVAAYQDRPKAEQTVEKLKPLGLAPRVVMKDIPGKGTWFRVIVNGFETREKAKAAVERITGKIGGARCVIRPAGK
jgi:cell division protein FtsN